VNVGDKQYQTAITRYNALYDMQRTWRQQQEFEYLGRQLDGAEHRFNSLRGLTDDYDQLRQMGDLGGVELL
jgi:hypothetical protein